MEEALVNRNRKDPARLTDYFNTRVRNAADSMKQRYISPYLFAPQSGAAFDSLVDAVGDGNYAGIATSNGGDGSKTAGVDFLPMWKSFIAEAKYDETASVPISPSLQNQKRFIRMHQEICGVKPQVAVTTGEFLDVLYEQVTANDQVNAVRSGDIVKWGFDALWINGVPYITDKDFIDGSDFDATDATRADCGGHQVVFLNFDYINLFYDPAWYFAWDRTGWVSPIDYTRFVNKIHFGGNIVCRHRRMQARIYAIDIDQAKADWKPFGLDQTNSRTLICSLWPKPPWACSERRTIGQSGGRCLYVIVRRCLLSGSPLSSHDVLHRPYLLSTQVPGLLGAG